MGRRMAGYIGQRFLHNAIGRHFDRRRQGRQSLRGIDWIENSALVNWVA